MPPLATVLLLTLLVLPADRSEERSAMLERAGQAVARGDVEEARLALQGLGSSAMIDLHLGDLLREQARPAEALEAYERALEFDPSLSAASAGLGEALLDLGRARDAVEPLEAASRAGSARILCALGRARLETGDPIGALADWRRAVQLDEEDESEKATELYAYFRDRHETELLEMREEGWEAHRRGSYEEAASLLLAWALAEGSGVEEALAGGRSALVADLPPERALAGFLLVEELEASPEQRAEALVGRGVARLRLEETGKAAECFEAAVALDEGNPEALLGAAVALARLGRPGEAAPRLEQALRAAEEQGRDELIDFARGEESLGGREADPRLREIVSAR